MNFHKNEHPAKTKRVHEKLKIYFMFTMNLICRRGQNYSIRVNAHLWGRSNVKSQITKPNIVHIFSNNFHFWSQNGGIYHRHIANLLLIARGEPTRLAKMFCFVELYIQSGNYVRFEKTRHFEQYSFIFYRFFRRIFTKMNPLPKPKEYAKNSKYILCSPSTPLAQESLNMEPIRFSIFQ